MVNTTYGALPGEWDHFDFGLDLTDDLLPVVSDPTAEISGDSDMKEKGKTPSLFNRNGKVAGIKGWTKKKTTATEITKWAKDDRLGICIQTRRVRGIDVDVSDFEEALDIENFLIEHLGPNLPLRRRGNSTKFLLPVIVVGEFTKRRFKTHTDKNFIEFLADGQQFIATGTHPSGVRYEWAGGLPDKFPTLTPEEFESLWKALETRFASEESITVRKGITPEKKRRLEDMNDPVVEYMRDHWTIHDIANDGRVDVTCPWETGHSTESGPTSTSWYPAGVGGFAVGHFKCLHTSCAHRTDRDFLNEIGYNAAGFDVIEIEPEVNRETGEVSTARPDLPIGIITNLRPLKKGQDPATQRVMACAHAVFDALDNAHCCGHGIAYDRFRDEIMLTTNVIDRPLYMLDVTKLNWRPIKDSDYFLLKMRLEKGDSMGYKFEPISVEMMRHAVGLVAEHRSFDSLTEYAKSLSWDGTARIDTFLRDYMGAEDTPYTRAISRYYWSALAGRALIPGTKADMVPIAVGKQGTRKTTMIRSIAPKPDMFVELDLGKSDADNARELRGKAVGELGEMKGFSVKMIEHIKSFVTREREEWTPKFKEFTTKYMRRCVFFGTTNEDEPLPADSTGQRRWLPFKLLPGVKCSVEDLVANRDQFWAEAVHLFKQHGVMWQDAERLAPHEHKSFEKDDSWTDHLREYLFSAEMGETAVADTPNGLSLVQIIAAGLSIPVRDINRATELRVADCLRKLGMEKVKRKQGKVWVRAAP